MDGEQAPHTLSVAPIGCVGESKTVHTVTRVRIVISNYHYIMRLLVDTIMIV